MDSVTQALLGAAVAGVISGKNCSRQVLISGAVLGTLPDLDVIINWGDAVANVTKHRGFSHSLIVLLPFSIFLSFIVNKILRSPSFNFLKIFSITFLCLGTHAILDAFTAYGTQLFWPLKWPPVAFSSIFIIDPFYTIPLLVGVVLLYIFPFKATTLYFNSFAVLLTSMYLFFSLMLQASVYSKVNKSLEHLNLDHSQVLVLSVPPSIFLWRVLVLEKENYYEGLVSVFDDSDDLVKLVQFPRINASGNYTHLADYKRLHWFTRGFIKITDHQGKLLITDMRLGFHNNYPFNFIIAKKHGTQWIPVSSTLIQAPLKTRFTSILKKLWYRTFSDKLDICEIADQKKCNQ